MTIKDQANQVRTALGDWARTHGGRAEIAGDLAALFTLLQGRFAGLMVVILFNGEPKRGEYEESGIVDRTFTVVLSRGRGFAQGGDSFTQGQAGEAPLFDVAEEAREVVRALEFSEATTEVAVDYKGLQLFEWPTDRPVDAYQFTFSVGTQLPQVGD